MATADSTSRIDYGRVESLADDGRPEWDKARQIGALTRLRWIPGPLVAAELPKGFVLEMLCATGPDCHRRLLPANPTDNFLREAALGGLALLTVRHEMASEVRRSYRTMQLLYWRVHSLKEHLDRDFQWSRDLHVRASGRASSEERDVLPESLGFQHDGTGRKWSVAELTRRGRALAIADGFPQPTSRQAINYGLFAAAERNPLRIQEAEVPGLVRAALFDGPPTVDVSGELADEIEARLLLALSDHLADDIEDFQNWFSGSGNSLFKQIAQQRRATGGAVSHAAVRRVLLDLGWRAYEYVAQCVDAQMRFFRAALTTPLNAPEDRLFENTFLRQPFLAEIPMVMLRERIPILSVALRRFAPGEQSTDDVELQGICHRLFAYYFEMAQARREADRRSQRASKLRALDGGAAQMLSYDDAQPPKRSDRRHRVQSRPGDDA